MQSEEQLALLREERSDLEDGMESKNKSNYLYQPLWWLGMIIMIIGELGNFAAYGFAPPVLIAPLGTMALITNAIIAPIFLEETIRLQDVFGTGFLILGTLVIVFVSNGTAEPDLTFDQVFMLLIQFQFLCYIVLTIIILAMLIYLSNSPKGPKFIWIDLCIVSIFGGYTVLSTKAVSTLFKLNFHMIFTHWITYVLLLVLIGSAVLQMKFLNRALARFDAVQVIPTNFVFFTTSTIIGSSVLYHDLQRTSAMSLMGVLCMFLGVFLITSKADNSLDSESYQSASTPSVATGISISSSRPIAISRLSSSLPENQLSASKRTSKDALRRLSTVLENMGTQNLRKIGINHFSEPCSAYSE